MPAPVSEAGHIEYDDLFPTWFDEIYDGLISRFNLMLRLSSRPRSPTGTGRPGQQVCLRIAFTGPFGFVCNSDPPGRFDGLGSGEVHHGVYLKVASTSSIAELAYVDSTTSIPKIDKAKVSSGPMRRFWKQECRK